jgi:hypothetical protein
LKLFNATQRFSPRKSVRLRADILEGLPSAVAVENLSKHGLYFISDSTFAIGSAVEVTMELPNDIDGDNRCVHLLEVNVMTLAKTAAKKRAARRRPARTRPARTRNIRPADAFVKALMRATNLEERAVNGVGRVGLTAINTFENMSRSWLGIPRTIAKATKRGRVLSWKRATLKGAAPRRGTSRVASQRRAA